MEKSNIKQKDNKKEKAEVSASTKEETQSVKNHMNAIVDFTATIEADETPICGHCRHSNLQRKIISRREAKASYTVICDKFHGLVTNRMIALCNLKGTNG